MLCVDRTLVEMIIGDLGIKTFFSCLLNGYNATLDHYLWKTHFYTQLINLYANVIVTAVEDLLVWQPTILKYKISLKCVSNKKHIGTKWEKRFYL